MREKFSKYPTICTPTKYSTAVSTIYCQFLVHLHKDVSVGLSASSSALPGFPSGFRADSPTFSTHSISQLSELSPKADLCLVPSHLLLTSHNLDLLCMTPGGGIRLLHPRPHSSDQLLDPPTARTHPRFLYDQYGETASHLMKRTSVPPNNLASETPKKSLKFA